MKDLLIMCLLFLSSSIHEFGQVPTGVEAFPFHGFPEYATLTKADAEYVLDVKTFISHGDEGNSWDVRADKWEQIKFSMFSVLPPSGPPLGRTYLLFLSKSKNGSLFPVDGTSSALGASLPVKDIIALLQNPQTKSTLDILPDIFNKETDGDCALLQARILAGGPSGYLSTKNWKGFTQQGSPKIILAQLLVGLYAVGAKVFDDKQVYLVDFSSLGFTPNGEADNNEYIPLVRNYIPVWIRTHGNSSNSTAILRFALKQKGDFQANILQALSGCRITRQDIVTVATLLSETANINAKYACVSTIYNLLNQGGQPEKDDFIKNPEPYIKEIVVLLQKNGYPVPSKL